MPLCIRPGKPSFCVGVTSLPPRVGNFRHKNFSAEDRLNGTIGLFRRNSGCSAEQKTLGIPFRIVPQRRQMLGILYHGTKIEANSRNSVLNHSAEQKTLGIPFRSMSRTKTCCLFCLLEQGLFVKLIFSCHFLSFRLPSLGIDSSHY